MRQFILLSFNCQRQNACQSKTKESSQIGAVMIIQHTIPTP